MPPCKSVSMYLQFISAGVTGFDDFKPSIRTEVQCNFSLLVLGTLGLVVEAGVRASRTINPYRGTVQLLSARAGGHLGSSQNLEGGIRASSSLPIGCQVSSDVFCLYEVQKGLGGITFGRVNEAASRLGLL